MTTYYQDNHTTIYHGDCLEVLAAMPDNSVDSIVTDPPYGLSNTKPAQVADVLKAWVTGDTEAVPAKRGGFMGKDWDSFVPPPAVWEECMRVLKPGGHMVVFAGARTHDLMGLSIRLAGFEIRDSLAWLYGSGFPKSHDIGKAIDKAAGVEFSASPAGGVGFMNSTDDGWNKTHNKLTRTGESTAEAKQWEGWGTALKPAFEPVVLARKPLAEKTVAKNVLEHGTGGINIDACRVPSDEITGWGGRGHASGGASLNISATGAGDGQPNPVKGRWPANVLLDEHAAAWVDEQSGMLRARGNTSPTKQDKSDGVTGWGAGRPEGDTNPGDSGGASRFYYSAKASKKERPNVDGVQHPTVKPLAIMEWLIRLVTPPSGTVLDPFAGSGTTIEAALGEGFNTIGIESEQDYLPLITARITRAKTTSEETS